MGLFSKSSDAVLGVDISANSVKVMEIWSRRGKFQVEGYAVEPLAPDMVVDKQILKIQEVGDALRRAVSRSGSRITQGAVAVSGSSVITKLISMPSGLSDLELESQVQVEAEQYLPFPLEEVNLDFEIIGPSLEGDDRLDILLAASRSDNVDSRVAALECAGLRAKLVDVEVFALENAVALMLEGGAPLADDAVIAVADLGGATTTFSVMEGLRTIFTREENFGGYQLTESIQQHFGMSFDEAEMGKRQGLLSKNYDNYEEDVLNPFKDSVAEQVSRARRLFLSSTNVSSVDLLVLSGGTSSIPGLADYLGNKLNLQTMLANPFADMQSGGRVSPEELKKDAPSLMVSCGLALRSFDEVLD